MNSIDYFEKKAGHIINSYAELRQWRNKNIKTVSSNHHLLNQFHDQFIEVTVQLAIKKVESEWGLPPAPFAFFLMGSGGRFEQSVWSDQDHGLIYEGDVDDHSYFLTLGTEISNALYAVGYEYCDGKVMSSNSLWCQSIDAWEKQITKWLKEETLESLRYFSTFFDSRVLIGEADFLERLKLFSFKRLEENPTLYVRLLENVKHLRKGLGPFGQLLPANHGEDTGTINLKETVFFSYVNALRLLALKEEILAPSTLSRFQELPSDYAAIKHYESDFVNLLNFRLYFQKDAESYDKVHLLHVKSMTRQDRRQLKYFMKKGYRLFAEVTELVGKGVE